MRPSLEPGLMLVREVMVNGSMLVPNFSPQLSAFAELPPVLATAYMVAFAEATCADLVRPHLTLHQRTVGTRVELSHVAATPRDMKIVADVELINVADKRLRFKVTCRDEAGTIGEGFHERAIIDLPVFMERLAAKQSRVVIMRRSASPLSSRRGAP